MKKPLAMFVFVLMVLGCVATPPDMTPDQAASYMQRKEQKVQIAARLITLAVMDSLHEDEYEEVRHYVHSISGAIHQAVNNAVGTGVAIRLDDMKALSQSLIFSHAKGNNQRQLMAAILDGVIVVIQDSLAERYANVDDNLRLRAEVAFVRGAAAGVMQATSLPDTTPNS